MCPAIEKSQQSKSLHPLGESVVQEDHNRTATPALHCSSWPAVFLQEKSFRGQTQPTEDKCRWSMSLLLQANSNLCLLRVRPFGLGKKKKVRQRSRFMFRVFHDHRSSFPQRLADCCPDPGQSSEAWRWLVSTAAVECHCQCSAWGSWKSSTFPRPCRSRCRGSWQSWAQPIAVASVLISWLYNSHSWGHPLAGPPDQGSSRTQRPLREEKKSNTVIFPTRTIFFYTQATE